MKIRIFINPARARRWHLLLAERFIGLGHEVAFVFVEGGSSLHAGVAVLKNIERFMYRKSRDCVSKRVGFASFNGLTHEIPSPDLNIDLTLRAVPQTSDTTPILRLLFDGHLDEGQAIAAILKGVALKLSVVNQSGQLIFEGKPAIEHNQLLSSAFDFLLARAVTVLVRAVKNIEMKLPVMRPEIIQPDAEAARFVTSKLFIFGAAVFMRKIQAKFRRIAGLIEHENQDHWRIAWRRIETDSKLTVEVGAWTKADWAILPDDNNRFYADPFVFEHKGQTYVFCEEFPYNTLKGVISVFTIAADGTASKPRQVLERPFHLSYPFVFERDGEIWMIPETYSSGKIELYRAERFPDKWVFEQALIDNVVASDATLFEKDGLLWLFAAEHDGGSSWDTLSLWYADTLKGLWTAHKMNPVLVDAGSARPAGKIVVKDGRIIRPVQNCSKVYGGGMVLKEVTQLDTDVFAEHEIADLPPAPHWNMVGVHTLNNGAGIEVIDQLGSRARQG